jgi:hypothetical protein
LDPEILGFGWNSPGYFSTRDWLLMPDVVVPKLLVTVYRRRSLNHRAERQMFFFSPSSGFMTMKGQDM